MINYKTNKQKNITTIKLSDEISITDANKLKTVLLNSIAKTNTIIIKLQKLKAMHLSILQLLLSAQKTALTQSKKIEIADSDNEMFKNILQSAGLSHLLKLFFE